jgi:hypothetical protein
MLRAHADARRCDNVASDATAASSSQRSRTRANSTSETTSVAKNASGDKLHETTKIPSRQIVAHRAPRKSKGGINFRLLSPKTQYATERSAA